MLCNDVLISAQTASSENQVFNLVTCLFGVFYAARHIVSEKSNKNLIYTSGFSNGGMCTPGVLKNLKKKKVKKIKY